MTGVHGVTAPVAVVALGVMSVAAAVLALLHRQSRILDWGRRAALGVLVAEAALGLALAVRGATPSQAIHWLYGAVIVVVLLIPGALASEAMPRARSGALALAAAIAAAMAWRLWGSG